MLINGSKIMNVAAIDGSSLCEQMTFTKKLDVSVIAHDDLILESPHVSFFVSSEQYEVGVA